MNENKTKTNDLNKVKTYGMEPQRGRKVIAQKMEQQNRKLEIVVTISNFTHLSLVILLSTQLCLEIEQSRTFDTSEIAFYKMIFVAVVVIKLQINCLKCTVYQINSRRLQSFQVYLHSIWYSRTFLVN